jgi:hypothetical protein
MLNNKIKKLKKIKDEKKIAMQGDLLRIQQFFLVLLI